MPNEQNEAPISLQELIHNLCAHPKMATRHGTFEEINCFLTGFDCATKQYAPEVSEEWHEFKRWLAHKLQYPPNHDWCYYVKGDLDNEAALAYLRTLFDEFSERP